MTTTTTTTRRKRRVIILTTVLVLVVAAIAVAIMLLRAGIQGSVQSNHAEILWVEGQQIVEEDEAECAFSTPFQSTGGPATLTMTDVFQGSSCTFRPKVTTEPDVTEGAVILGVDLPGLPSGWEVTQLFSCGLTLDPNVAVSVPFTVTMTEQAEPGSGAVLNAGENFVEAVPVSQFEAAMCA